MAPMVKKAENFIKIGKVAFGKLPDSVSPTVVYGVCLFLVLIVVYFVYSTMSRTTSIVSNGSKSSPKKSSPKKVASAASVAAVAVTTNGNGNGKESKTPKKTPSKGKAEAAPTPIDNTARKSERLRGKTPKKWD